MRSFFKQYSSAVIYFAFTTILMGIYSGMYEPSFNNYLAQVHQLNEVARGGLELPREMPGFLVAARETEYNKEILTTIIKENKSNFLSTNFIF